jgi:hypothetical protein
MLAGCPSPCVDNIRDILRGVNISPLKNFTLCEISQVRDIRVVTSLKIILPRRTQSKPPSLVLISPLHPPLDLEQERESDSRQQTVDNRYRAFMARP